MEGRTSQYEPDARVLLPPSDSGGIKEEDIDEEMKENSDVMKEERTV